MFNMVDYAYNKEYFTKKSGELKFLFKVSATFTYKGITRKTFSPFLQHLFPLKTFSLKCFLYLNMCIQNYLFRNGIIHNCKFIIVNFSTKWRTKLLSWLWFLHASTHFCIQYIRSKPLLTNCYQLNIFCNFLNEYFQIKSFFQNLESARLQH